MDKDTRRALAKAQVDDFKPKEEKTEKPNFDESAEDVLFEGGKDDSKKKLIKSGNKKKN